MTATANANANANAPDENMLLVKLDQLITTLSKPAKAIPADKVLWDAEDIGAYLRVSARHASERYACRPDFPKAIHLPTEGEKRAIRRWRAAEVMRWAEARQEKRK